MADVLSHPLHVSTVVDRGHHGTESEMLCSQASLYPPPEPNPPFHFPLQAVATDERSSSEPSLSLDAGQARRSVGRSRPQRLPINELPPFEFYPPTKSRAATPPGSPARSPTTNTSFPSHSGGHGRNTSETAGVDGNAGGLGSMNASPTKGKGALPTPPNSRTAASGGRRGHNHRRSGAISSHDVSVILKTTGQRRGNSAPTTPCISTSDTELPPAFSRATSHPVTTKAIQESPASAGGRLSSSADGSSRPRVGFSDTVEFIPRPLSTISSETSSSRSTLRASHSVTGSITSIISASTSSPPQKKGLNPGLDHSPPRSSATDALVSGSLQGRQLKDLSNQKRPSSASAAERSAVGADNSPSTNTWKALLGHTHPPLAARSDSDLPIKGAEGPNSPVDLKDSGFHQIGRPPTPPINPSAAISRTSPESKAAKRQTKVKSWAGSILSRRAKSREAEDDLVIQTTQTPVSDFAPESDFCLDDVNFDEDTTCVIHTPPAGDVKKVNPMPHTSAQKHYESNPEQDADCSLSILDLDVALGQFNTPGLEVDSENAGAGGFPAARRKMHSSGATGGFSGPGMHYYRRTESAPEMPAINYQNFGFPRLGSNPAMADVFEEEEEDSDHVRKTDEKTSSRKKLQEQERTAGLGVEIVDEDSTNDTKEGIIRKPKFCVEERQSFPGNQDRQEVSFDSTSSNFTSEEFGAVEIVSGDEEPRFSVVTKSSDESTVTPTLSHGVFPRRPASAPLDLVIKKPSLPYMTPESSSCVSSPDFSRCSFDVPRMHTANSSITDRITMSSSRTFEQGRSMRGSADDVPSLISSASTAGSASAARGSCNMNIQAAVDHTPSLSIARSTRPCRGNASKRSSLASIKFFGSYHGEKSKLNIEERVPTDSTEGTEKKKGNRISRLMRFWKSKEKTSST